MEIEKYVSSYKRGNGRIRVIDEKGAVIVNYLHPEGGTPIDFVSAKYLLKKGEKLETVRYKPNTYRFFK